MRFIDNAAVAVVILMVTLLLLFPVFSPAHTLYPGQWAQIDPAEREWLNDQHVPGSVSRCCNEADGIYAEEDIRDGHYWTRFSWFHPDVRGGDNREDHTDWMMVPEEAVIHDANRHGAPVVWWAWVDGFGADAKVKIRCYAPGVGI